MAATPATNHQIRLAARPVGLPTAANWQATEEPVSEPAEGGVLVKVLALSLDPAMRGWMNEGKSYIRPVEIGEVMRAGGVGRVVASRSPKFARRRPGGRHLRRAGVLVGVGRAVAQERPAQDRPAAWAARRSGSTCSACRA